MSASSSSGDRGASLVEYALVLALVAVAIIGGLKSIQDGTEDDFGERAASIGDPGDSGGPPSTSPSTTTPPSTVPPTTTLPPGLVTSCVGATCDFSVSNPPSGATYSWTTTNSAGSGTGPTFSHTRAKNAGDYRVTVVVEPGSTSLSRDVSCSNGSTTVCS